VQKVRNTVAQEVRRLQAAHAAGTGPAVDRDTIRGLIRKVASLLLCQLASGFKPTLQSAESYHAELLCCALSFRRSENVGAWVSNAESDPAVHFRLPCTALVSSVHPNRSYGNATGDGEVACRAGKRVTMSVEGGAQAGRHGVALQHPLQRWGLAKLALARPGQQDPLCCSNVTGWPVSKRGTAHTSRQIRR